MKLRQPLVLLAVFLGTAAYASSLPNYPFEYVRGRAERKVPPNTATCSLTVVAIDPDPINAEAVVTREFSDVLAILAKAHVARFDIDASNIGKTALTNEDSHKNDAVKVRGYRISRGLKFKVEDLGQWAGIVKYLLVAKHIDDLSVEYGRSDHDAIEAKLELKAVADAKQKANTLAAAVGRRLGPVTAVSRIPFDSLGAAFGVASQQYPSPEFIDVSASRSDAMLIPPTIKISTSVNVVFKLE